MLFCIVLVSSISLKELPAKQNYHLTLDASNGLPSNHVYYTITDRNGYLWISTPRGVVRYNGYEFRLFNLSDGLSSQDVWELMEDRKGRVWLFSISEGLGYIRNGKYHNATIMNGKGILYPYQLRDMKEGIVFLSNYVTGNYSRAICVEKKDSIYVFEIDKIPGLPRGIRTFRSCVYSNDKGQINIHYDKELYSISLAPGGLIARQRPFPVDTRMVNSVVRHYQVKNIDDNMLIYSADKDKHLCYLNFNLGKFKKLDFGKPDPGEAFEYVYIQNRLASEKRFFILSNKRVIEYKYNDSSIAYAGSISIKELLPPAHNNNIQLTVYKTKDFWGPCTGSATTGLTVDYGVPNHFIRDSSLDLKNYNCLRDGFTDSLSFWWNRMARSLLELRKKGRRKIYKCRDKDDIIATALPFGKDTILLAGLDMQFLRTTTGKMITIPYNRGKGVIYAMIRQSPKIYYQVCTHGFLKVVVENDTARYTTLDMDRYNDLVYDSLTQSYWAYNTGAILIHKNGRNTLLNKEKLLRLGIQKVQQIVPDNKYGNIFIRGADNIVMYNHERGKYVELFKDFNLTESLLSVYHDKLIVSGPYGVLFCKILGRQQLTAPLLYPNLKDVNYNFISAAKPFCGKLLLNTDKGTYTVKIPPDSEILHARPMPGLYQYRYVLSYNDSAFNFSSSDTLAIDQKNRRLQFDVINPYGHGRLRYKYRLQEDAAWHDLNANEITLASDLKPGYYYKLALKVNDNAWRGGSVVLYIYILPYWWQTNNGKRFIDTVMVAGIVLLLAASVLITRRIVLHTARKRHLRMELELRSIYAQINPHFIFNSLGVSMLLVSKGKMEEAYEHISRFSRLLRAYLRSSRNKYISISEEVANLTDYIELQQARFSNKFDYRVSMGSDVDGQNTMIPSLLVQPFVENAINHGILPKKEKGRLEIRFTSSAPGIINCVVEDDGIGRNAAQQVPGSDVSQGKTSYGNMLIKDLVAIFNKYEKMNIHVIYTDKQPPLSGTIVNIQIQYPYRAQ